MSKAVANLTQSTETITFSAQDNGETINVKINELARGPAGADGPNSVTSATTSDGTANLSLSNVTTATATVTGTLTANHIHGNIAGSVYEHVRAGEDLAKGDPVYISGSHGTGANLIAIVSKADASDPLKMPAVGVMDAAVTANANGHMVITGTISDINTATYAVNAELYVAEGGGFTATPPNAYAQPIARVERSNTNNGAIIVKVNGLSASDATGNTLVRRTSTGGASFGSLTLTSALALSSGGTGGTTAGTARTNLGLGTADTPTFSNLTLNTGTITVPQPLSFSQTWNSTATFTALQMNITDSGPANAASLLMDLRVGGITKASVNKSGRIFCDMVGQSIVSNFSGILFSNTAHTHYVSNGIQFTVQTGYIAIGSGTNTRLYEDAANTLAQRNGTNAQVTRVYDTYTSATDYHRLAIATARATATAMSGATITLTNIIPAGAVVVGVTCKVTTAITGATSFDIGTATDVDRFGAAIAVALGTTSDNRNWTAGTIECFPTATSLILTANGSNFTAGAVYVSVQYLSGQAD